MRGIRSPAISDAHLDVKLLPACGLLLLIYGLLQLSSYFLHTLHVLQIMSFFGFEQQIDLEEEKRKILERGIGGEREDLAVYTWGEESYDGLGDALQEGGDELNDETFGGATTVGEYRTEHKYALLERNRRQGFRLRSSGVARGRIFRTSCS